MNHRAAALENYERALRRGATADAAWTAAFGSQTQAELASEIRNYVDGGQYEVRFYSLAAAQPAPPVEHRLTDADVHATRALLYLTGRGTRDVAPVDIVQARHATQADPKDWLAWLLLADGLRLMGDQAGGNAAALRATEAANGDPSVELPLRVVERN
jgi:hypothetical protein